MSAFQHELLNLPLSQELLLYYRERVEKSERDYQEALNAIDSIKLSHQDYHTLYWELHQRVNEIADLQKEISNSRLFLAEERKQLLKAVQENDALKSN